MSCTHPIDAAILADYWSSALAGQQEEAVEAHLLGCAACSTLLEQVAALIDGVRQVARSGSLRMVVSEGVLERARREGLTVREYAPPQGGSVQCTVTAADNLLIGRLAVEIHGGQRVDLVYCDPGGAEIGRLPDIPVAPGCGQVILQESITFAKAAPDNVLTARLMAQEDAGGERLIGEYTFNHTRSMPGKAAW
ncbi:MAG TPA: hypothetical protein VFI20_01325 [Terracidiphilus sp.]|nr:hypothetical protein [Terracidiphilus sp.]